jgi:hypothetical protein
MHSGILCNDDFGGGFIMRLKGYFTLEASYIFTAVTLLVVGLIRLDFYLHDSLINDTAKILGALRYFQVTSAHYDMEKEAIDRRACAKVPVMGYDTDFNQPVMVKVKKSVSEYFYEKSIGLDCKMSSTDFRDVIFLRDNAEVVRSGGKLVQVVGGLFYEN